MRGRRIRGRKTQEGLGVIQRGRGRFHRSGVFRKQREVYRDPMTDFGQTGLHASQRAALGGSPVHRSLPVHAAPTPMHYCSDTSPFMHCRIDCQQMEEISLDEHLTSWPYPSSSSDTMALCLFLDAGFFSFAAFAFEAGFPSLEGLDFLGAKS